MTPCVAQCKLRAISFSTRSMNQHLNTRERELVRAATQFKKRAQNLIKAGKLEEEHQIVLASCDRLLEQVYSHAENRAVILQQHENLKKTVTDNARCPNCRSNANLKLKSVDTSEKGWKMNRYRCRKCNLDFTWNRPNNPWDMLQFFEDLLAQLDTSIGNAAIDTESREQVLAMKEQITESLSILRPVVESADQNLMAIRQKDDEMARMLHEFKNYLLIEKIKLDKWDNHHSISTPSYTESDNLGHETTEQKEKL